MCALATTPVTPHVPPWLNWLIEPNDCCIQRSPSSAMRSPPIIANRLAFGPSSGRFASMSASPHCCSNASAFMVPDCTLSQSAMTFFFGANLYQDLSPGVPSLSSPSRMPRRASSQVMVSHLPSPRAPTRRMGCLMRFRSCTICGPACPLRHAMPPERERDSLDITPIPFTASASVVSYGIGPTGCVVSGE